LEGERPENRLGIAPGSGGTYGDPWGLTGTLQTDFGFTGEPTGMGGLVYLRARYYNPAMGTFTGLDPIEEGNRYAYVNGDPINRRDPIGLCPPALQSQKEICALYDLLNNPDAYRTGVQLEADGELTAASAAEAAAAVAASAAAVATIPADLALLGLFLLVAVPLSAVALVASQNRPQPGSLPQSKFIGPPPSNPYPNDDQPGQCDCDRVKAIPPDSSIAFDGPNDLLCNLKCYNGNLQVEAFGRVQARGVNLVIPAQLKLTYGLFAPLGFNLMLITEQNAPVNNRGGIIFVPQPMYGFTRADRLATLVEEIRHAMQYHSLLAPRHPCPDVTVFEGEVDAKTYKVAWAARSGIPTNAFPNTPELTKGPRAVTMDQYYDFYGDAIYSKKIFVDEVTGARCPDNQNSATEQASFGCIDPLVRGLTSV
jgi:RHS repeat-associated protein